MTSAPGWTRRLAAVAAALVLAVVLLPHGVARADVAFRKKKAPAGDATGTEAAPSGGEASGEIGNETPAASTEGGEPGAQKGTYVPQAEDRDRPKDPSLLAQTQADAAVAAQARKAKKAEGPPFYTKWQFWAITGAVVVGAVAAIWGGSKLLHEMQGGDVRACNVDFAQCFGAGH